MIALFWLFAGLMLASSLCVVSLTIFDAINDHKRSHCGERQHPLTRIRYMSTVDERVQASKVFKIEQRGILRWQIPPSNPESPQEAKKNQANHIHIPRYSRGTPSSRLRTLSSTRKGEWARCGGLAAS